MDRAKLALYLCGGAVGVHVLGWYVTDQHVRHFYQRETILKEMVTGIPHIGQYFKYDRKNLRMVRDTPNGISPYDPYYRLLGQFAVWWPYYWRDRILERNSFHIRDISCWNPEDKEFFIKSYESELYRPVDNEWYL